MDTEFLSLNAMLTEIKNKDRPGIFGPPDFPCEFGSVNFDRQTIMNDRFLVDTNLQNEVKNIWMFFSRSNKDKPIDGKPLDSIINLVKNATDKIKARGGQVIFVRTPSSGPFWMGEKTRFPRKEYWDKLLAATNSPGIHFQDYSSIANFQCPEFSHLSPKDATAFTRNFVKILEEKGWSFPHKPSAN